MKVIILQNIFNFEILKSKIEPIDTSDYKIKLINSNETHSVRHPVLRAGKPIESCVFEGDDLETTIHMGIFVKDHLIGVCSFYQNSSPKILEIPQYQLRGMAILKAFQGKGLGKIILRHGEKLLNEKKSKVIWCNARELAVNFYKKNNYKIVGEPFSIKNIGVHYVMYKVLSK